MPVLWWKKLFPLVLFFSFFFCSSSDTFADGTYANINTAHSSVGSADTVSWSQSFPITIDSYGNYISPIQTNATEYYWAYSNDKGANWSESIATGMSVARPSVAYDSISDKLHVLYTNGANQVVYLRYIIRRNKNYQIVNITQETAFTSRIIDTIGTCTSMVPYYPTILWKNTGAKGTLAAFWVVKKTCAGTTTTEVRGSMRALTNDANDAVANNWAAINGSSDAGSGNGPASVPYNELYKYSGASNFSISATIKGGSGSQKDDIYLFNSDENTTNGFRRLSWNSGSSNWSGTWTSRVTFGGNVDNTHGYNAKDELLSKPVYASTQDRIYVGIARWLDNTNGDTQSLYYVDSSDNLTLAGNVYSASGAHCLYPTFDLMYDSNTDKVYFLYLISGVSSVCGNTYYKTYDGSSFSAATPFYTVANRSVDIPIVYQSRDNDRVIAFFRLNNAATPGSPPHEIYFGYIPLNSTATNPTLSVTSPHTETTFSDFNQTCATFTNTEPTNTSGEVSLLSSFRDDFETSRSPYNFLFNSLWSSGVWNTGTYDPTTDGNLLVFNAQGSYVLGQTTFTQKTLEFNAKFTSHNFQHIGWVNDTGFGQYIIFSTFNNGQLNARASDGSEVNAQLGSSYLDSFHNYKIDWNGTNSLFYIDGNLVATLNKTTGTALTPIASNITNTAGSDLTLNWLNLDNYPSTTGTYQTCSLASSTANTTWGALTYAKTTPASTTITVKSRTSEDNSTWSSWSSNLNSGDSISSPNGKYLQLQYSLTGTSTSTPTLDNFSLSFTPDTSAPNITSVSSTPSDSGATITWTTNENASSKVDFGMTNAYGSTTSETDTSTRVTSHSVSLSSLLPCTLYHFRVKSTDSASNLATGADNNFNTTGCTGSSTFTNSNSASATTSSGGSLSLTNSNAGSVTLGIPSSFASTDATFQAKQLDKTSVIASTGSPSGFTAVGNHVYDFKAYQDATTAISSFLNPITITVTYTDADVVGLDTSTLKIYRYANSTWNLLTNCTVNTTAKTVSCTTTGFSTFVLFGQNSSSSSSSNSSSNSSQPFQSIPPSCDSQKPGAKLPWLYGAIPNSQSSITLYYTHADNPVDHYVLEYGSESGKYIYAATNIGDQNSATYTVQFLKPNSKYYFRIRAGNGCAVGSWSNEISATTKSLFTKKTLALSDTIEPENTPLTTLPIPKPSVKAAEKSKTTDLTISVTDKDNHPVSGAKVTLHSTPRDSITDKNGQAIFKDVETGQHKVIIAYQDYLGEQSINLNSTNQNISLTIKIEKVDNKWNYVYQGIIVILLIFIFFIIKKFVRKPKK